MRRRLFGLASNAVALAAACGAAYLAFALHSVRQFGRREYVESNGETAVTVLKPLCGLDPELFENLASFCNQRYGTYQVVFGVRDADDPAIAVIERVIERFPERDLALVIGGPESAANPKVANIANMLPAAKHDWVVIADADVRVGPRYLRSVLPPLTDPGVGAVTCLYNGSPLGGMASFLAAMFVDDQFAPSVLVAQALEPLRYCFGATVATRRTLLDRAIGTCAMREHIADDHMLGRFVSDAGLRVELSPHVVEIAMAEPNVRSVWLRELRWCRTIRTLRPWGYAFSVVTHALPLALVAFALAPRDRRRLCLLAVAVAFRVALHYAVRRALGTGRPATPHMIPLRDALSLALWACGLFGRTVLWRGRSLDLDARGRIAS